MYSPLTKEKVVVVEEYIDKQLEKYDLVKFIKEYNGLCPN